MATTPIGFGNFSNIANVNLTLNIPEKTNEWIPAIIQTANTSTNGLFTFIMMFVWWFILFYIVSDKTPFGDFRFSDPRAFAISLGITTVLGITMLETGFFTNLKSVAVFLVLFIISGILSFTFQNRE